MLAKLLKVRRMYRFMPALVNLENYCDLYGCDIVKLARQFGLYLERNEPGQPYARIFSEFVEQIYSTGDKIRDWNINTLADLDMPNREQGIRTIQEWSGKPWSDEEWTEIDALTSQAQYIRWELKKQDEYRRKLSEFLDMRR